MTTEQKNFKLLSTIALRNVLKAVIPLFEKESGRKVEIDFGATAQLCERIRAGQRGDMVMAVAGSIEDLILEGIVRKGTRTDMVASDVGMAVKQGASVPDISTKDALVSTLLATPSIVYSKQGASGMYFASLLKRLGIEEQIRTKATVLPEGLTGELVASGQAVLAVQQMSELMQVSGIHIFAKLPPEVQQSTIFSSGLFEGSTEEQTATALSVFMRKPSVIEVLRSQGLDPL